MNITRFTTIRSIFRQSITRNQCGFKYNVSNSYMTNGCRQVEEKIRKVRYASTCTVKNIRNEKSLVRSILDKIPFLGVNKTRIKASAYLLYEEIVDTIDYVHFYEKFNLPDTFYSWFVIIELHIWLLSVRAMSDGENGRHLRNYLVEALWGDVAQRVKQLGTNNSAAMREHISELSEQLQAALIAYDEGLQSNDMVLAGALWRRFYQSETADLVHLENLVKYVRKQIMLLDNTSSDTIFNEHVIHWAPLVVLEK